MRGLTAAWLALTASGCSFLLSYPDECRVDCPEGRAAEGSCTNGVDDDGDGRTDVDDAACWSERADPRVERCASVGGGMLTFAEPLYWVNSPYIEGTSLGSGSLVVASDTGGPVFAATPETATGAFSALAADLSISPGTRVIIGLVPLDVAPAGSPPIPGAVEQITGVVLDTQEGRVQVLAPGYESAEFIPIGTGDVSVALRVDPENGGVSLMARQSIAEVIEVPLAIGSLPRSRLMIQVEGVTTFREVTAALNPVSPCGFQVPEIHPADADVGAATNFARGPGDACALLIGCEPADLGWRRALTAWRSTEEGAWGRSGEAVLGSAREPVAAAALAWDAERGTYVAAVVRVDASAGDGRIELFESTACDAVWNTLGELGERVQLDPSLGSCDPPSDVEEVSVGYAIRGGEHVLWLASRDAGRIVVRTALAREAAGAAFVFDEEPIVLAPALEVDLPISFTAVGPNDVALLHRIANDRLSIGLSVMGEGFEPMRVDTGALLAPSGEEEMFDRLVVPSAALVWDGPETPRRGTILYAGRGDTVLGDTIRIGRVGSAPFELVPRE